MLKWKEMPAMKSSLQSLMVGEVDVDGTFAGD